VGPLPGMNPFNFCAFTWLVDNFFILWFTTFDPIDWKGLKRCHKNLNEATFIQPEKRLWAKSSQTQGRTAFEDDFLWTKKVHSGKANWRKPLKTTDFHNQLMQLDLQSTYSFREWMISTSKCCSLCFAYDLSSIYLPITSDCCKQQTSNKKLLLFSCSQATGVVLSDWTFTLKLKSKDVGKGCTSWYFRYGRKMIMICCCTQQPHMLYPITTHVFENVGGLIVRSTPPLVAGLILDVDI